MYLANIDFQLAIILSIIYVLGMNVLSGRGIFESFDTIPAPYAKTYKSGNQKLLEPTAMLYPGCLNITMNDLLKAFDGDQIKLQNTVQYTFQELMANAKTKSAKELLMKIAYATGLPYNLSLDDPKTPAYIATLLMNYGYKLSDTCRAPNSDSPSFGTSSFPNPLV